MRAAIVGGGASGLACAVELLKNNVDVTLFEKNNLLGKKLSITGNGKCNICNDDFSLNKYYNENTEFLQKLFNKCTVNDIKTFFNELGIELYEKDGYYYPMSNSAKSIVYALEDKINSFKNFKLVNKNIDDIKELNQFDKIILATGGLSYSKTGSTGFAYEVAYSLGHKMKKTSPALCPLLVEDKIDSLAGTRINAKCTLLMGDEEVYIDNGNVQFNKDSISGIPVMNSSRFVARNNKNNFTLVLDLMSNVSIEDLVEILLERRDNISYREGKYFLSGMFDEKIASFILNVTLGKSFAKTVNDLTIGEIDLIADFIKNMSFKVRCVDNYDNAQITTGGIDIEDIDDDFSSKKDKKIHFIGECLDVDGICGGYNLTFAFASGITCAKCIAKS